MMRTVKRTKNVMRISAVIGRPEKGYPRSSRIALVDNLLFRTSTPRTQLKPASTAKIRRTWREPG